MGVCRIRLESRLRRASLLSVPLRARGRDGSPWRACHAWQIGMPRGADRPLGVSRRRKGYLVRSRSVQPRKAGSMGNRWGSCIQRLKLRLWPAIFNCQGIPPGMWMQVPRGLCWYDDSGRRLGVGVITNLRSTRSSQDRLEPRSSFDASRAARSDPDKPLLSNQIARLFMALGKSGASCSAISWRACTITFRVMCPFCWTEPRPLVNGFSRAGCLRRFLGLIRTLHMTVALARSVPGSLNPFQSGDSSAVGCLCQEWDRRRVAVASSVIAIGTHCEKHNEVQGWPVAMDSV